MKTAKLFFTVVWRGVCQCVAKIFGLFGYNRDSKFAKIVWELFATSGTITMAIIALALVIGIGEPIYGKYFRGHQCSIIHCYYSQCLAPGIYFHNTNDHNGYIFDSNTQKKTIEHVEWIAYQDDRDSLACFCNGKKRGYFNKYTGREVIGPRYDRAWVFSEGLASVVEDGRLKFIDTTGTTVIDMGMTYSPVMGDWVFHSGYCIVCTTDGNYHGLMDKEGTIVLPMEYSSIELSDGFWELAKGDEEGVLDMSLNTIIPLTKGHITTDDESLFLTTPDHIIHRYDLEGRLTAENYITSVRMLEYEKDEIVNKGEKAVCVDGDFYEVLEDSYHPKATARLRAYVADDDYEGLMTADGRQVTRPVYTNIEAIGPDLYLCSVRYGIKAIVNGRGETVCGK